MHFLRFRRTVRTVVVDMPDGSVRKVRVETNDARDVQQVEDGDRLHGHVIPAPVAVTVNRPSTQRRSLLLRNAGMPRARQRFDRDRDSGLWRPEALWLKDEADE
jgi:hypothetical protein